jgi:serine protease Do
MTLKKFLFFSLLSVSCFLITVSQASSQPEVTAATRDPLSKAFTAVAKKAIPAVVFLKVKISQAENDYDYQEQNPFDFGDDFFNRFFGAPRGPRENAVPEYSRGSGFFIDSSGYIVTNAHVVKNAEKISAVLNDGRELDGTLIGADPHTDIAVIKVEGKDFPYLNLGDSDAIEIGEWVVAIGSPFQLEASLTVGVVSAKGRQDLHIADLENFIQTDAAINPGNSGGPLLNLNGEVIGINTAIVSRSGGYMGIGFAIPSNMAQNVTKQIIQEGNVSRGFLGVSLQPLTPEIAAELNAKKEGVLVAEVIENSPAYKAGLKPGDIIVECNGKPVTSPAALRLNISLSAPGTAVELKAYRKNQLLQFNVVLSKASDSGPSSLGIQKLGLEVDNLNANYIKRFGFAPNDQGIVVTDVKPGSPAAAAKLPVGSLIIAADHKRVLSVDDFQEIIKQMGSKKRILILARYRNINRFYLVKLD